LVHPETVEEESTLFQVMLMQPPPIMGKSITLAPEQPAADQLLMMKTVPVGDEEVGRAAFREPVCPPDEAEKHESISRFKAVQVPVQFAAV